MAYNVLSPEALILMGAFLALCGLALALLGKKVVGQFLSLIGSVIGGTAGYIVGGAVSPNSPYLAIVLGFIGLILGSLLLSYAPNAALAFFTGFLAAVITYLALGGSPQGDPRAQDSHVMVALLVMVLVFAVIYYFIDELMVAITALIGGVLAGAGVFLMTQNAVYGGAALGAVFLLGATIQYAFAKRRERRTEAYPG